jgi:EAL domain-containing protein (putative c-di-GMP-specific phosphodiesterase class I)
MGGEVIQGFLFSKPLSAEDAVKWVEAVDTVKQA